MTLIWATRGRDWGFKFIRNGGHSDPLLEYDKAFAQVEDSPSVYRKTGSIAALRFPDPQGRRDRAGRVIPHEFVIEGNMAETVRSVEDGLREVWPLVADEYMRIWDQPYPSKPANKGEKNHGGL